MGSIVLLEEHATAKLGKPIYFQQMTVIGPMTTPELSEAAKFDDRLMAMRCPAWRNQMCSWKCQEIGGSE